MAVEDALEMIIEVLDRQLAQLMKNAPYLYAEIDVRTGPYWGVIETRPSCSQALRTLGAL